VKKGGLKRSFQIGSFCPECFIDIEDAVDCDYAAHG
jgi:hypothetical protein